MTKLTNDLLFELGTEELPIGSVQPLAQELAANMAREFTTHKITYGVIKYFATPRRIAVFMSDVLTKQHAYVTEQRGPAYNNAFNDAGEPTVAAIGFAKSCKVNMADLEVVTTANGKYLVYNHQISGKETVDLLPEIITKAVAKLTIAKPMRWGSYQQSFVRPVHWSVLLYGDMCLNISVLGVETDRISYGHRFHHPQAIIIQAPHTYEEQLNAAYVIADFSKRQDSIRQQLTRLAAKYYAQVEYPDELLATVTSLVEWPVVMQGNLAEDFLRVPSECLITAMQYHQKYFPLYKQQQLLAKFLFVANIASKNPATVISGNEKVLHARLSDAAFFYHQDLKQPFTSLRHKLTQVAFQQKLGNLYEKTVRLAKLAELIATKIHADGKIAYLAGEHCKNDLVTSMVGEFPELQGTMNKYYAKHEQLDPLLAEVLADYYRPRFAKDLLPSSREACSLALADRIDNLIGTIGTKALPTGTRDPFGMRRQALASMRIVIEQQLHVDLLELLQTAYTLYPTGVLTADTVALTMQFYLDRLRSYYQEQNVPIAVFYAVQKTQVFDLYAVHLRILAVQEFMTMPHAPALILANKRVANILQNSTVAAHVATVIDATLLEMPAEQALYTQVRALAQLLLPLLQAHDYRAALNELTNLAPALEEFFVQVMVLVDDVRLRNNRLALLRQVQQLFLQIADVAELQGLLG